MSKRALKKYIADVPKEELERQLLDLYTRFPSVKKYYDFIFNPREEIMVQEAMAKIRNEYFPVKRKRPRARRSVAQRYIKQFQKLEMDAHWVAELMIFNLETAQAFEKGRKVPLAFYKSMLNSFSELIQYVSFHQLLSSYKERILVIYQLVEKRNWEHVEEFNRVLDSLE